MDIFKKRYGTGAIIIIGNDWWEVGMNLVPNFARDK